MAGAIGSAAGGAGHNGTVGSIPPADLTALLESYKTRVEALLARGRTSTSLVPWRSTGNQPSGYAFKMANQPFLGKVERYQTRWNVPLAKLADLWQRMAGAEEPIPLVPSWVRASYTTRQEDLADATTADALNLPEEYIARILGLAPAELEAWRQRNAAADEARAQAVRAQLGADFFGGAVGA